MGSSKADMILAGASLSNCLLAWFLKRRRPELRILVYERESRIPSLRTWSFHRSDVGAHFAEIEPLITRRWPQHEVRLPNLQRRFESEYCAIRPSALQTSLAEVLGSDLIFDRRVEEIGPDGVRLENGEIVTAGLVLDGRNCHRWRGKAAYQKFVGLQLRLSAPHQLTHPILMDARVPQVDGYRFFYVLPWSATEILVEDTRYSANPGVDLDLFVTEIEGYVALRGWQVVEVLERESGALPLPMCAADFMSMGDLEVGASAGFFHPVTGYSLPTAVQLAARISAIETLSRENVAREIAAFRRERRQSLRFLCMLNRMMFMGAEPSQRYEIFKHFYTLPQDSIERFYAGRLRLRDSIRLLSGRPPIGIPAALRSIFTDGVLL